MATAGNKSTQEPVLGGRVIVFSTVWIWSSRTGRPHQMLLLLLRSWAAWPQMRTVEGVQGSSGALRAGSQFFSQRTLRKWHYRIVTECPGSAPPSTNQLYTHGCHPAKPSNILRIELTERPQIRSRWGARVWKRYTGTAKAWKPDLTMHHRGSREGKLELVANLPSPWENGPKPHNITLYVSRIQSKITWLMKNQENLTFHGKRQAAETPTLRRPDIGIVWQRM